MVRRVIVDTCTGAAIAAASLGSTELLRVRHQYLRTLALFALVVAATVVSSRFVVTRQPSARLPQYIHARSRENGAVQPSVKNAQQQLLVAMEGMQTAYTACKGSPGSSADASSSEAPGCNRPPLDTYDFSSSGWMALEHTWWMLAATATTPAEMLLPPPPALAGGITTPAPGASTAASTPEGWRPLLSNVAELDGAASEGAGAASSAARVLQATAAFTRQLQGLASQVVPGAAAAAYAADSGTSSPDMGMLLQVSGISGGIAGGGSRASVQSAARTTAGPVAAAVEVQVLGYADGVRAELTAMEDPQAVGLQGEFQSFPMVRRAVVAALAAAAVLHRTAAGAPATSADTAASSWGDRVDERVLRLLAHLYSLHRRGAVHKQGVELLHVSKSGGTSLNDLAGLNGCLAPADVRGDNGLLPPPWDDRPRWLALHEAKARFRPVLQGGATSSIVDWWSDVGPRNPATYRHDARRGPYCSARLTALSQQYQMQFSANEYTLYGGQDNPRDTFTCPQLLNTVIVREPHARLVSHLLFMIPELAEVAAGSTAAFQPGGGAARAADWDAAAPFLFDNFLSRTLLGEAVFRSPVGSLRDVAQRFFPPAAGGAAGVAAAAGDGATAGAAAAGTPAESPDDLGSAWGRMAAAARLLLQQFDVVMVLEDGEGNRPHFSRGLGWSQPLDVVRRRVGSDASIQVDAAPLLPPDLAVLLRRHTLDSHVYSHAQLFSRLDRVVWDTARQLEEAEKEAEAWAAASGAAARCSEQRARAKGRSMARLRRRALRRQGLQQLRAGNGSGVTGMPALVQQLLAAAADGSRHVPDSVRQAVAAAMAVPMPAPPAPALPTIDTKGIRPATGHLLRQWNVTRALELLLAGRQGATGVPNATQQVACSQWMSAAAAKAAWGALDNTTCGWVGVKLRAVTGRETHTMSEDATKW